MTEKSELVTLKAGEEAVIESTGTVTVCLKEGSAEIAAVLLKINTNEVFALASDGARKLSVTTTGGCIVSISHNGVGKLRTTPAHIFDVSTAVRKVLSKEATSRVLVVGGAGVGKSYAASTICNSLAQAGSKSGSSSIVMVDGDISSNTICAGCISSQFVTAEEHSWPGRSSLLMPISFFVGAGNLAPQNIDLYFHLLEQSVACAGWMAKSKNTPISHVVIDAPAAPEGVDSAVFQRRLVETVNPTHLFFISSGDAESKAIQEDLRRQHASMKIVSLRHLTSAPFTGSKNPSLANMSIEEYFVGPANDPLGCMKVVARASELKLHHVTGGGREGTPKPSGALSAGTVLRKGMVLAVSHASVIQELPFANVVGLVLVSEVDEENDEVVLVVPSGDAKIPRAFFIVPSPTSMQSAPLVYTGDNIDAVCV